MEKEGDLFQINPPHSFKRFFELKGAHFYPQSSPLILFDS